MTMDSPPPLIFRLLDGWSSLRERVGLHPRYRTVRRWWYAARTYARGGPDFDDGDEDWATGFLGAPDEATAASFHDELAGFGFEVETRVLHGGSLLPAPFEVVFSGPMSAVQKVLDNDYEVQIINSDRSVDVDVLSSHDDNVTVLRPPDA